jgi:hypothetical protein
MSERLKRWQEFAERVEVHIEQYTVPQYGDWPDDQMAGFCVDEIKMNIKRYLNRIGRDQRGIENSLMDCKKIAHYACEMYLKMSGK